VRIDSATGIALVLALAMLQGCARSAEHEPGTPAERPADEPAERPASWTMHVTGYGPIRAGMALAEAERILGEPLLPKPQGEPCAYVMPWERPGVAFMVVEGRIARFDVRADSVKTDEGAGIGDSEARIHALYPGRVEVQPHKYVNGHYLIVRPAATADSTFRLIFETDGKRVTTYRSGRLPEVRWIEGCS
jgi:hypothetical protein